MFGVDGDQVLRRIEWDETDPKSSYCVSRVVENFKEWTVRVKSCDEPWTIPVNGECLSDDLKKNSQGRNPRIHEEKQPGMEPKDP